MRCIYCALISVPALTLGACYVADKENDQPFPTGNYCFNSDNESLVISGGKLSSSRGGVDGALVSLHYGAKTGDRFIYITGVQLRYDEVGELVTNGKTPIGFWAFGNKRDPILGESIFISTRQKGYIGRDVEFKQVNCD